MEMSGCWRGKLTLEAPAREVAKMADSDAMPKKLLVLVVWLALGTLMQIVQAARGGDATAWVSPVVSILLIIGVLKGSEGARLWLMFGAIVGLVVGGLGAVLLMALGKGLGIILGIAIIALAAAPAAYMLWCLRQEDVQKWMFYRSLGKGAEE
jgi:hypothetical protein